MKIKDIVRTAVIRTNPYWPFSLLNKIPYHVAIKTFIQFCKRFREIKSIYLRHGLVQRDWIPALSDIDLTVIIDSKLSIEQEFWFLRSFWARYEGIKKLFPMLGEIEILNTEEVAIGTQFGLPGYEAPGWKLVYGAEVPRNGYIADPTKLTRDSLNHALWFYLKYFLEIFIAQKMSPYLGSQDLKRLRSKILRCLDSFKGAEATPGRLSELFPKDIRSVDVFRQILHSLDEGICRFDGDGIPIVNIERPAALEPNDPPLHEENFVALTALARLDGAIKSVIVNRFNKIFVILQTALDARTLKTCMETMSCVYVDKDQMPTIVSSSIFEYMLRHYEPFEYASLVKSRKVLFGEDLLSNIQAPSHDAFVHYLLGRVPNLLTFPRSSTVIWGYTPTSLRIRKLECIVEHSLLVRLYLEKGMVQPWYHELLAECHNQYSETFMKLHALKERGDADASRDWFELLRSVANDIHSCLANSTEWRTSHQTDRHWIL